MYSSDIIEFVNNNSTSNLEDLIFAPKVFEGISNAELVEQIKSKKKLLKKMPIWAKYNLVYPKTTHIEQSSSHFTGKYKSTILTDYDFGLDLTAGFGVDSYYLSKVNNKLIYNDLNTNLKDIVSYNFGVLGISSVEFLSIDAQELLEQYQNEVDFVYIDPLRRDDKDRFFDWKQYSPNIDHIIPTCIQNNIHTLIKLSPMVDISLLYSSFNIPLHIHIVSVYNEVKEILLEYKPGETQNKISICELAKNTFNHTFLYPPNNTDIISTLPKVGDYLYQSTAVINKSSTALLLAEKFELGTILNPKLFVSEKLVNSPFKAFEITEIITYSKKQLKRKISSKNFTIISYLNNWKSNDIRQLFKVKESDTEFVILYQILDKKWMLFAKKIEQ